MMTNLATGHRQVIDADVDGDDNVTIDTEDLRVMAWHSYLFQIVIEGTTLPIEFLPYDRDDQGEPTLASDTITGIIATFVGVYTIAGPHSTQEQWLTRCS